MHCPIMSERGYYDLNLGRWVSRDPALFDFDEFNLYAYGINNSINKSDPTGLLPVPPPFPKPLPRECDVKAWVRLPAVPKVSCSDPAPPSFRLKVV